MKDIVITSNGKAYKFVYSTKMEDGSIHIVLKETREHKRKEVEHE